MAQYYVGDRVVCNYSELTGITGFLSGAVATTWDSGYKEYLWVTGGWVPLWGTALTSGFQTVYRENYLTTGNMLSGWTFTIPNSRTYGSGSNTLNVFVEGILQQKCITGADNDYVERSSTQVSFTYAIPSGVSLTYQILAK